MQQLRIFESLALVAAVLSVLLLTPAGSFPMLPGRFMEKLHPHPADFKPEKSHTERIRLGRETSESIHMAVTTQVQPPAPEEPLSVATEATPSSPTEPSATEGSTSAVQCTEELRRASTCKSLKQRLQEYMERPTFQYPIELVHNAFSLEDLKFFNLLGEGRPTHGLTNSDGERLRGTQICNSIISQHYRRLNNVLSGNCSWEYVCSRNVDRFPSIRIEARLLNQDSYVRQDCAEVRTGPVVSFEKRPCPEDPCVEENWVPVQGTVIVGYKETRYGA